jgi:hypothetical protein
VFADYMEAYGRGGLRAMKFGRLKNLAALYWYTVEFGLIETPQGIGSTARAFRPPRTSRSSRWTTPPRIACASISSG